MKTMNEPLVFNRFPTRPYATKFQTLTSNVRSKRPNSEYRSRPTTIPVLLQKEYSTSQQQPPREPAPDMINTIFRPDGQNQKLKYLPVMNNFLIEKCNLKDRYKLAEMPCDACSHCSSQRTTQSARNHYGQRSASSPLLALELTECLGDLQIQVLHEKNPAKRRRKKIVVYMPKTDGIYKDDEPSCAKATFLYTHRKG